MTQVIQVEYLPVKDVIGSTDDEVLHKNLIQAEPVFYTLDNGETIAVDCHCEECAMLNAVLLLEGRK